MIVPDHWAESRKRYRDGRRQITVRRFGWSMRSAQEAKAMAEERADVALRRLIAGAELARREPKVAYNGAEGVPIREEVLARHGDDVVTRNAYGAHCLNSPDALFADVDFEPATGGRFFFIVLGLLALAAAALGLGFGSWRLGLGSLIAALVVAGPVARLIKRLGTAAQGGPEGVARRRLAAFLASHPQWSVRIYRTPGGLRLLATHQPFEPQQPEVAQFFEAVGADPLYVRMCRNQQCVRARLTAKPWRIGIASHMRPRPGVWPVAAQHASIRESWVAEYEARATAFASCKYIESLGSGAVHPRIQPVIDLHDSACKALDAAAIVA